MHTNTYSAEVTAQTKFVITRRLELDPLFNEDRKQRNSLWVQINNELKARHPESTHTICQIKKRYQNVRSRYVNRERILAARNGPPQWEYWNCFHPFSHLRELQPPADIVEANFSSINGEIFGRPHGDHLGLMDGKLDSPDNPCSMIGFPDSAADYTALSSDGRNDDGSPEPETEALKRSGSQESQEVPRKRRKRTPQHIPRAGFGMMHGVMDGAASAERMPPPALPGLPHSVGFIGAGKMATAMANGFISSGLFNPAHMYASCPREWDSSDIQNLGVTVHQDNSKVAESSNILILAVKPDVVVSVLRELSPILRRLKPLILSVAAGITLEVMEQVHQGRYIRVMPNTPALYPGYGACVYCPNAECSMEDAFIAERMLTCLGFCSQIEEKLIDAVTGLSGSGPAYIFTVIEALSDGGVKMGLPRELSTKLAAQTVLGAAKMVVASGIHPAVLRDNVASPGGTTIHGLHALEQGGLRNALINAVEAATKRSAEMGQINGKKK